MPLDLRLLPPLERAESIRVERFEGTFDVEDNSRLAEGALDRTLESSRRLLSYCLIDEASVDRRFDEVRGVRPALAVLRLEAKL